MLIVISPAKKLDYETAPMTTEATKPRFLGDSEKLINTLRDYSSLDLMELMNLSMNLAELNFDRYEKWTRKITKKNAKQCLLAFKGDVYTGMDAESFNKTDIKFAQKHLRILSGLYGVLRPLDLMMPYRLEMGTRLKTDNGKNLYEFWGSRLTASINQELEEQKSSILINLASNEYFKSIKKKELAGDIITPQFKEKKNGAYKMIGIYAKRARGLMSRHIIKNRLKDAESIKEFSMEGYRFNPSLSTSSDWVFTRDQGK